jgi:hypothetical protein
MTAPGIVRDRAMEARVVRTLEDAGLDAGAVQLVRAAHELAMEPRRAQLTMHHPDFLHPGRTVLVLVVDCGFHDSVGLAAAALLETERPELRADPIRLRSTAAQDVTAWLDSIPLPGAALAEELLSAPRPVQLVALAERLDQCRHAKFWADPHAKRRILEEVEASYGPIAQRVDEALGRRFAHWAWAFGRSLERGA